MFGNGGGNLGYVLPAIPDTLLETLKHRPSHSKAIKQVEPIERITPATNGKGDSGANRREVNIHPYKGKYVDLHA